MNQFFIQLLILSTIFSCNNSANKSTTGNTETRSKNGTFEGQIIYDFTFEDKLDQMTKEQALMFMGNEQIYTIKGNKYKSEMNGSMKMSQYYLGGDTLFNFIGGMNTLFWNDATVNDDKVIDFEIIENVEKIAGVDCNNLKIKTKEGTYEYFYNSKYAIDPNDFAKHEYGFWNFCVEKTKSLPLKSITSMNSMYLKIIAKEIKAQKVEDAEFVLPNLKRIKSPE